MELVAIALTAITYVVLLVLERTHAGRAQPAVAHWQLRGAIWFAAAAAA